VVLIPYFFYGQIGLFRVILGIFESFSIVLFTMSAISIFVTRKDDFNKKYKNNKWPSFIAALSLIIVLLFFLKITIFPHLGWFQVDMLN
jgi:amino acid transporter